jgi:GTP cyclohydrolase I
MWWRESLNSTLSTVKVVTGRVYHLHNNLVDNIIKKMDDKTKELKEQYVKDMLLSIGEDPQREGLLDTPKRIVKSWDEIYSGYSKKPSDILTVFHEECDEMVLLKDIELFSMCEHHILPFYGKAHVAYIPKNNRVIGISKLARLVDIYARRLQIQERIGQQVTQALMDILDPYGSACVIEATHMCMRMRGVGKQNSVMTTSSMRGVFKTDPATREEFMNLIKNG